MPDFEAWKDEFLKEEAQEVVEAVGAWIFCFPKQESGWISEGIEQAMKDIQEVVERHSYGADVVMLAVAKDVEKKKGNTENGTLEQEEQEDKCMEHGFEYIDYAAMGKNQFGEKVGFERLKEALEANEWAGGDDEEDELNLQDLDFGSDEDLSGFGREEAEMTAELFGMKAALNGEEDDDDDAGDFVPQEKQAGQVDDLDRMMEKLLAIKEQSADLPEAQRKRMAAQAVKELMKEHPNV